LSYYWDGLTTAIVVVLKWSKCRDGLATQVV